MARRFYLAKFEGDGLTPETAYRIKGCRNGIWPSTAAIIVSREKAPFVFVDADTTTTQHNTLVADSNNIFHLNGPALDSALTSGQRNTFETILLSRFGLTRSIPAGATFRQALRAIKREIDANGEIL